MSAKLNPDGKSFTVTIPDSDWHELRDAALADDKARLMRWVLKLKKEMDAAKTRGPEIAP